MKKNILWMLMFSMLMAMGLGSVAFAEEKTVVDSDTTLLEIAANKPEIKLIANVVYEQVPSRGYENVAMKMDVLKPLKKEKMPAVLFITGGGFINANKDNGIQQRMALAEAGYVVASVEYRVAPTGKFPEPLEDVKAAIRYLKAHADQFNIDPERVGVLGGSAGGYLSAMVGVTNGTRQFDKGENLDQDSTVKAAVDVYGLSDLTKVGDDFSPEVQKKHKSAGATEALWVNGSPVFGGLDGGILADPEKTEAANPLHYISDQSAPFLLLHGSADTVVSPSQTELLHKALRAHGIPSTRYLVKNAQHGGVYWVQPEVLQIIQDFFDKYLKDDKK